MKTWKLRLTSLQLSDIMTRLVNGAAQVVAACGMRNGEAACCLLVRQLLPEVHDLAANAKIHREPLVEFRLQAQNGVGDSLPHDHNVGAVVLSDAGEIVHTSVHASGRHFPFDLVTVVGDDIVFWFPHDYLSNEASFAESHRQAFGSATTLLLSRLSVAVVGCSGTGSPVAVQLARLGVKSLTLVDADHVEVRNLNRIYGSSMADAQFQRSKVEVLKRAIGEAGLGTDIRPIGRTLCEQAAICAVAEADVVFGCMDGAEGRHVLNRLATFYTLPYFDVGIRLEADGHGGVRLVCGSVHYLQPGRSSLLSRRAITREQIEAEALRRTSPADYEILLADKYIIGASEPSPAVISVNTLMAGMMVSEFLARVHPHRAEPNSSFAITRISLTDGFMLHEAESAACPTMVNNVGLGDVVPILGMPALATATQDNVTA